MSGDVMTKTESLEQLLKRNPKAAVHGDSIRTTLEAVRKLREAGISSQGKEGAPLTGRRSVHDAPKPTNRKIVRSHGKMTFYA